MSETMAHRIQAQAQSRPHAPAYYVKSGGSWVPTDWSTYAGEVRTVGRALVALGIDHGDAVGILGFNTPDWVIMDCAAFSVGAVPAGIYTTCSSEEVEYILQHSEAKVALVRNVMQWEKVQQVRERLPKLEKVVTMRGCPAIDDPMVISWETFCGLAEGVDDTVFDTRMAELKPDQLATLIYTSGTTGPPKGVMLTHDNLAYTADLGVALSTADSSDCALSYLPLSHIAEQMFSIHVAGTAGYAVYYATSIDDVAENLKEVQPTVFFGVPRIWEKFYAGLSSKLSQATGAKLKLVTWARGVGTKVSGIKNNGGQPTGFLALQYRLADKLIFSKIKPAVGLSRAKIAVSGAAPITREVLEFMASLDILVSEVYGQSEGSGPTSFNSPGKTKFGTVGPPLPGVEVKLAEDGEILVGGRNVFAGYYKDPEATAATLDADGFLLSGDLGAFDADGFLKIVGRKKEIIITAGGKNITPKNVEEALKSIPLINEAVMIGDARKFCSAVLTYDPDLAAEWAKTHSADAATLHENADFIAEVQKGVDVANAKFARVEQIRKFAILPRNFTMEDKELTPTLKVKRRIVYQNWSDVIEGMYAE